MVEGNSAIPCSSADIAAEGAGAPLRIFERSVRPTHDDTLVQIAFLHSLHSDVVGKSVSCLAVDVQAPLLAPLLELGGFDDSSDDVYARSATVLFASGGSFVPLGVGVVQGVAVGHELFGLLKVLFEVPDHA